MERKYYSKKHEIIKNRNKNEEKKGNIKKE